MDANEKNAKLIELKAKAYDALVTFQQAQNNLKKCNDEIARLQMVKVEANGKEEEQAAT